ncbi:hypothetical protein ACS0TY_019696 [Phlomoides rotata]
MSRCIYLKDSVMRGEKIQGVSWRSSFIIPISSRIEQVTRIIGIVKGALNCCLVRAK